MKVSQAKMRNNREDTTAIFGIIWSIPRRFLGSGLAYSYIDPVISHEQKKRNSRVIASLTIRITFIAAITLNFFKKTKEQRR